MTDSLISTYVGKTIKYHGLNVFYEKLSLFSSNWGVFNDPTVCFRGYELTVWTIQIPGQFFFTHNFRIERIFRKQTISGYIGFSKNRQFQDTEDFQKTDNFRYRGFSENRQFQNTDDFQRKDYLRQHTVKKEIICLLQSDNKRR